MRAAGRGGCPGGERHSPPRNNARRREPLKLAQPRDATPRTAPGPARPESAAPTPPAPLTSHRSPRGHCRPPRSCPNKRRAAPRPSPPRPAQRCPPPIGSAGRPSSPLRDGPRPLPVFIRSPLVETRPPPARREVIGRRGGAEAGRGRVGKGVLAPRATWVTSGGGAAPPRCFARNGAGRVGRRADPERLEAPGGRFGRSDRGERSAAWGTRPQGAALRTGAGKPCKAARGGEPPAAPVPSLPRGRRRDSASRFQSSQPSPGAERGRVLPAPRRPQGGKERGVCSPVAHRSAWGPRTDRHPLPQSFNVSPALQGHAALLRALPRSHGQRQPSKDRSGFY